MGTRNPALLHEAPRLAEVARRYWGPGEAWPGLRDAGTMLAPDLPDQVESLGVTLLRVHETLEKELLQGAEERGLWDRGRYVLVKLRAALEFVQMALETPEHAHPVAPRGPADPLAVP